MDGYLHPLHIHAILHLYLSQLLSLHSDNCFPTTKPCFSVVRHFRIHVSVPMRLRDSERCKDMCDVLFLFFFLVLFSVRMGCQTTCQMFRDYQRPDLCYPYCIRFYLLILIHVWCPVWCIKDVFSSSSLYFWESKRSCWIMLWSMWSNEVTKVEFRGVFYVYFMSI